MPEKPAPPHVRIWVLIKSAVFLVWTVLFVVVAANLLRQGAWIPAVVVLAVLLLTVVKIRVQILNAFGKGPAAAIQARPETARCVEQPRHPGARKRKVGSGSGGW